MSTALVRSTRIASQEFDFTAQQKRMMLDMFLNGASETEAAVLIEVARIRRLNPFTGQVHFVKRWDAMKGRDVWACQVGIDGFRSIAERTGDYDGQDEAEFEHDKQGRLVLARVRVYRKSIGRPFVGRAKVAEFIQTKRDGTPTYMWLKMPENQTAKCAEAQAFRKAFPDDFGGLFIPEEITRSEEAGILVNGMPTGEAANDNAQPDPIATFMPRLKAATNERELRKVAASIAKANLTPAQRTALLDAFQNRLCALRSTPPTTETPQGPETPPDAPAGA